jgi:hypothetical protein
MLKEPKCDINEGDNNDSSSISLSDNDVMHRHLCIHALQNKVSYVH